MEGKTAMQKTYSRFSSGRKLYIRFGGGAGRGGGILLLYRFLPVGNSTMEKT